MVSLADRRRGAEHLEDAFAVSERRACRVVEIARSTKRRPSGRTEDIALVAKIHELSERYPRFGYQKIHALLRAEGFGKPKIPTPAVGLGISLDPQAASLCPSSHCSKNNPGERPLSDPWGRSRLYS